jgi:nucleoside-diphosphate-sugar epimerase
MAEVLLTGATGFLGQHLLRELTATGTKVRALSRSTAGDARLRGLGAEPVRGDVTDADAVRAAMAGVDAVFHAAADTNTWRPNNDVQTRTNVGGAQNLLAAAKANNISAFMHTSSISAYSHLVHGTLREDVPERGGDSWINYERTKFLAEKAVRESGLRFIIFQPAHILGPGDTRNWSRLIRLIDLNKLPGAPPGLGTFADVREIAKAQVRAWQRGKYGETYLFGGEQARFLALIHKIGAQLGRKTPKSATPAFALKAYAQLLYAVSLITRKMPEITPEAATFTCHDLMVDSGKAMRELDYKLTDLDALLADTIAWMREEHMLL